MEDKVKGVYRDEFNSKYIAYYWDKKLKKTVYIGSYSTLEEAVKARKEYIVKAYDGLIERRSSRKRHNLPKGITLDKDKKFQALVTIIHGKHVRKKSNIYLGRFDTVEEAVRERRNFILSLL